MWQHPCSVLNMKEGENMLEFSNDFGLGTLEVCRRNYSVAERHRINSLELKVFFSPLPQSVEQAHPARRDIPSPFYAETGSGLLAHVGLELVLCLILLCSWVYRHVTSGGSFYLIFLLD